MSDKHPSPTTTTTTLNEVDKTRTPPTPIVAVHEPPMPPSSPPPPRPSPHSSIDSSPSSNVATGEHSMTSTGQPHLDPTSTTTTTTTTGTEKTPSRQPSSRTLNAQQRRSLITKFATIHTDKYPENLRREFPMSNFDRNLTVEKARFEPQPLNHDTNNTTLHHHHHPHHHHPKEGGYSGVATPATTTTSSSPPHDHLQAASSSHHRPTTASSPTSYTTNNSITPSASSTTGLHTASSTYSVNGNGTGATSTSTAPCGGGNTTPAGGGGGGTGPVKPIMQPTKSRSEGDRTCRTNKKRRRPPPPVSGTATPAEVFHRNLIDAVSNVEDSDENEHYVYSYGGATTIDPTSYHSDLGYHRPQSIRSSPPSSHHPENKWLAPWSSTASFFSDLFRINSNHSQRPPIATRSSSLTTHGIADDEAEAAYQPHHRPKLRNYVIPKQHPYADPWATAAGGGDHHHWYDSKRNMIGSAATTTPSHHLPPPPQPSRHRRRIYPWAYHTDGYSSDDEDTPLMMGRSLRSSKRSRKKKRLCSRVFRNTMLAFLFLVLATCFLVLYRAKPLVDIGVEMGRVLASDKELIFDLRVKANNWNWWTVRVADADISMFAFSQVVPLSNNTVIHGVDPAEYLGSFYRFDEPLAFPPAMLSREQVEASSQIRIKSPGADKSGNERWSRIIRYPYGLVARGVLKYRPLPFTGAYSQSVAICDVARVEPISGVISEDPDQSYCLKHAKGIDQ